VSTIDDSEHFGVFAKVLKSAIAKYGSVPNQDLIKLQRVQVEALAQLEIDFRQSLETDPNGNMAYEVFLDYILEDKRNILAARPYFRERRKFFKSKVSAAIRDRDIGSLKTFHLNYHFIKLVTKTVTFKPKTLAIIEKIKEARQQLVVMNLPLVINRARIFWSRTPKSHCSFLDLIQMGAEGLISAVDKFAGEYTAMYRGVIVGRVVGNLVEGYSKTMVHFYPADKRRLYRANKYKSRHIHGDYDIDDLVAEVSKAKGNETNAEEIVALMAAASIVSIDAPVTNDTSGDTVVDSVSRYEAPAEERPDNLVEVAEVMAKMSNAYDSLTLFQKKILRLKGVDIALE